MVERNDINIDQVAPAVLLPSCQISLQGSVSSQIDDNDTAEILEDNRVIITKNRARIDVEVPILVEDFKNKGLDSFYLPLKLKFDHATMIAPMMMVKQLADGEKKSQPEPTIEWLEVKVLVKVDI